MAYPDDRNACLAKDFLCFIENGFNDDNRPLCFLENEAESSTEITKPWVTFASEVYNKAVTTLGENRRFIRQGMIIISVFVPTGTKTADMNEIIEKISNHYEGKTIKGVNIIEINCSTNTENSDKTWFKKILRISYRYYTVK